ncbi:hypothetical protein CBR_g40524 [Chara braunii]|uniref:Uncharacterized protein n=1 Tax=Chara braunii TaxID=69332 RepID=A0A388K220_CHABU|nr:hypothetical protein CBR_g40524 [Chara braunii]|eukprot:GBG64077.1 hypothetical protein CBR_g40524 [Chara braunii]
MDYQTPPASVGATAQPPNPSPAPPMTAPPTGYPPVTAPPTRYPPYPYGWALPLAQPAPPPTWQYGQQNQNYTPAPRQNQSANSFPGPGNRAWFTREHLELIEKWKNRDILDEAKKKTEDSGECSKSVATKKAKGKAKASTDYGEQCLKNWLASNFGPSLKRIFGKLDAVDKKNKEADIERDKVIKRLADLEAGNKNPNGEGGSNEKRKRIVGANSPMAKRQRSRTRSRSRGIKMRQPSILVSSDEEGKAKEPQGATIEGDPEGTKKASESAVKLEDVMKMLVVIAGKENVDNANDGTKGEMSGTAKSSAVHNEVATNEEESENSKDDGCKLKVNKASGVSGGKNEVGIVEYMRQRLDHYMKMNGRKLKSLCAKRNVKWERKDKGACELAKQDTDEFTKLINGDDELTGDDESDSGTEHAGSEEEDGSDGVPGN